MRPAAGVESGPILWAISCMTGPRDSAPRPLRFYADFNSGGSHGDACWCLCYQGEPLDGCERELRLQEGQHVVLYYEDSSEEFEVDAVLELHTNVPRWQALPNWETMRRLRG